MYLRFLWKYICIWIYSLMWNSRPTLIHKFSLRPLLQKDSELGNSSHITLRLHQCRFSSVRMLKQKSKQPVPFDWSAKWKPVLLQKGNNICVFTTDIVYLRSNIPRVVRSSEHIQHSRNESKPKKGSLISMRNHFLLFILLWTPCYIVREEISTRVICQSNGN